MDPPFPIAVLILIGPFAAGLIAAYFVGNSPRVAVGLAVALVLIICLAILVHGTAPFPSMAIVFIWSWGVTAKLIWERHHHRMPAAVSDRAHISQP